MLTKVLHREKGSMKLLAEFPNKAFELIPAVFIVLETVLYTVHFTAFCLGVVFSRTRCIHNKYFKFLLSEISK